MHSRSCQTENGTFNIEELKNKIREEDIHYPDTGLICIENAHSSGAVVSIENMKAVYELANDRTIPVHMDGARFFNAARHLKADYKEMARYSDTLSICLSKGLCAPIGSLLVGPKVFIERAKRNRKLMGGGMRQVGILGAAGIVALKTMIERLDDDHENAKYMSGKLKTIKGVSILEDRLDINMVFFTLSSEIIKEETLIQELLTRGFKVNGTEDGEYRFVTNHGVARENIDDLIEAMKEIIALKS